MKKKLQSFLFLLMFLTSIGQPVYAKTASKAAKASSKVVEKTEKTIKKADKAADAAKAAKKAAKVQSKTVKKAGDFSKCLLKTDDVARISKKYPKMTASMGSKSLETENIFQNFSRVLDESKIKKVYVKAEKNAKKLDAIQKSFGKTVDDAFANYRKLPVSARKSFVKGLSEIVPDKKMKVGKAYKTGITHPVTNVSFVRKKMKIYHGKTIVENFPVFDATFDTKLSKEFQFVSDKRQFTECNRLLRAELEANPELCKKFTKKQLKQIKQGITPEGFTWHHNEDTLRMQLVDSEIHRKTSHIGGKKIWGGGAEYR